jgi:cellulose synthase operon protein C
MRLLETIAGWLGRVEVVLAGVEGQLRDGEEALARGDAMHARKAAKAILARVPHSPLGLALLADACEGASLDAELALTLEELAGRVASRADVWVRLGRARERVGSPPDETRDAFLRALAVAEPGSDARREALLWLADLDLSNGDGPRAELWLERLGANKDKDVVLRRAEARLLQNDVSGARAALEGFEADPTDGRAALLQGRALAIAGDPAAFPLLLRAMVLETPGSSEALASALAWLPTDEATRTKVRTVVDGRGGR